MWSTPGNGWLYGQVSETAPRRIRHQGTMAVLCQMVEWFSLYMSLATSQESFLKMKGHLLKRPLHFPKHKGSPLWWPSWGLSWTPRSFRKGHRLFQQHWLQTELIGKPPCPLGPSPNWQLLGGHPGKGDTQKVNTMSKIQRGPDSLCLENSLKFVNECFTTSYKL